MAKFFRRGISKVKFCPTVAGTSPTRPEITGGTDLTPFIVSVTGFGLTNTPIPIPNLGDRYTSQIPGEDVTGDSSFTVDDDDAVSTVRTSQAKGTTGFIVLMPYGDVPTKRCEVWAVTVTGFNDVWSADNTSAKALIGYAVTAVPNQTGVIPA